MNLFKKMLFSTRLMALLFISFAVSMAIGTFIESIYDTTTARILVYNAKWFEIIILLFLVNFIGNIKKYQLLRKEKWAILMLHLSFIFIVAGAFTTRYISYEGVMPIREGKTANTFLSDQTYLTTLVDGNYNGETQRKTIRKSIKLSEFLDNNFKVSDNFRDKSFTIEYKNYFKNAKKVITPSDSGNIYLKIVESSSGSRHKHYLKSGEIANIHNILFSLNKHTEGAININTETTPYTIQSPFEGDFMRMADRFQGKLKKETLNTLSLRSLYNLSGIQFVIPEPAIKGEYTLQKTTTEDSEGQEALVLNISLGNQNKTVELLGGKGYSEKYKSVRMDSLEFHFSYGSISRKLPFSITLNDFIAEKYPGTEKGYASFKSKVSINGDSTFDYDIYMNHVLDYKGYRFFQASFDPDEKGTVLSVNHDFWGTWLSYIGYFLFYLGLMGVLFYGKSYFRKLGEQLDALNSKKATLTIFLFVSLFGFSQHQHFNQKEVFSKKQVDSIIKTTVVSENQASKFGALIIQDNGGRIKPINTFSSELLRKLSKKDTYLGLNSNQVFLSILAKPTLWYYSDIIYLKRENDSIREIIGIPKNQKRARMIDFFDKQGNYKLQPFLQDAYRTSTPNQFQKDFRNIDLKLGILNQALGYHILKLFPVPNDSNNLWISPSNEGDIKMRIKDSLYSNFIKNAIPYYLMSLKKGQQTGDFSDAEKLLKAIKTNQNNYGKDIVPSEKKIQAEIIYNKYDIFKKLFSYYMYLGILLLFVVVTLIIKKRKALYWASIVFKYGIYLLFGLHTLGLVARWYISGHAPWSDAYESMIYVSWATMGMGILFSKKSLLTLAATAFVTAFILMVAHWNWLDPAIANLQPVLNSYWLMVHVAIIVASYGPFTLGMILGILALFFMIFTTENNKERMKISIRELTIINELSLTVGLVMLSVGNFLGGQWANESWGRYWGWDPKETWALISIMVYAFVLHMRFIPKIRSVFTFNLASILAFSSIMMTYFGVNFYLVGLHSYASGENVVTPNFIYYSFAFIIVLATIAYFRNATLKNKKYEH